MKTRKARTLNSHKGTVLFLGLGVAAGTSAQEADSLNVDLAECVALESETARFTCYEERVNAALEERNPPTATEPIEQAERAAERSSEAVPESAPTQAPEPEPVAAPVADAGPAPVAEPAPAPAAEPVAVAAEEAAPVPREETNQRRRSPGARNASGNEASEGSESDEIFATVTALREMLPNTFVITLDNGQIWQQTQAKRYPMLVGSEVRLYATRWGSSYRLSALDRRGFITVRRVR